MCVLDKLAILEEKAVLMTAEKMKINAAYNVKRLRKGFSNWDKAQPAVHADLRLTMAATGEYQLPVRYAKKGSEKALNDDDIANIHKLMDEGYSFYVVKHGTLGGSPDVDLISAHES